MLEDLKKKTYNVLLQKVLANVDSKFDKREGSILYDCLAPLCLQLADAYQDLCSTLIETFASSSNGIYLDLRCSERNVVRLAATTGKRLFYFSDDSGPRDDIRVHTDEEDGVIISSVDQNPNFTWEIMTPYSLPAAVSATCSINNKAVATAGESYPGIVGNNLSIAIVEAGGYYLFNVYYNDTELLSSTRVPYTELFENIVIPDNSVVLSECSGTVEAFPKTALTGGMNKGTIQKGYYVGQSTETGLKFTNYTGAVISTENLGGAVVELVNNGIIVSSRDEETDDELRARYFKFINSEAFGGNIAHYTEWCLDENEKFGCPTSIGAVQVYPVWNGGGTVLLSIVRSEDFLPCSDIECEAVREWFDPIIKDDSGTYVYQTGAGIAPIGHKVTVVSPSTVSCSFKIIVKMNYGTVDDIRTTIIELIQNYLLELRQNSFGTINKTNNKYSVIVKHSHIVSLIDSLDAVADVDETLLLINGQNKSLTLVETATINQVPIYGGLELINE